MAAPRTVVCFGDSNSYGTPAMATLDSWGRFAAAERWPGVMAAALGPGWALVEEALPGRTTVHDDPVEGADRNGLTALPIVLGSHRPIDLLIIMLGTNDLKARFAVTPEDIASSVGTLVKTAKASIAGCDGRPPRLLVVAPPPILETGCLAGFFRGGTEKSRALAACYQAMGTRLDVPVLDSGTLVAADPVDGIHLTRDSHATLGHAVAAAIGDLRL